MTVVIEYVSRKAELEEKIKSLESEKNSLISDIAALKEKISMMELERIAKALESEVQTLRNEKELLEQRAAEYNISDQTASQQSSGSTG
jgi:peptidoglycan hydrolase CwlO-like protein